MSTEPLKKIGSYQNEQIDLAAGQSPAIKRYIDFIKRVPEGPSDQLRIQRHTAWLECALATAFDLAGPEQVVRHWSAAMDKLLIEAWRESGCKDQGLAVYGLGKLGSKELNLSSDVDLLYVSKHQVDRESMKCLRQFTRLLTESTHLGFCTRVDTDLRPGGRFGPLVPSRQQFEDYYFSQGATWERVALVRARPIAGPPDLLSEINELVERFSYRKFIDYTLLEDFKNLRSIRLSIAAQDMGKAGFDLKNHPGAIRDIELYLHSLLVIHGGKKKGLRTRSTSSGYKLLIDESILEREDGELLLKNYWQLRRLENYVQLIGDQQTHKWHKPPLMESFDSKGLNQQAIQDCENCDQMISELIGPADDQVKQLPSEYTEQETWLLGLGFSQPAITEHWSKLMEKTAKSLQSQKDEVSRRQFLYLFAEDLNKVGLDQDLGLALLCDFIGSTHAKASFFSLLVHEPKLRVNLATLFSTSPYLGGIISSRPELLDSFVFRAQENPANDWMVFLEQLTERRLLTEIHAASDFMTSKDIYLTGTSLSDCADGIVQSLLEKLENEHGSQSLEIIALGKWGGRELGFRSDLDFIFIVDSTPDAKDHKVIRRLINRLTEQHKGGALYSVDLRLRPSGNAGPLVVTRESLKSFLSGTAPAWVRQSYLRGRSLRKSAPFNIASLACKKGLSESDLQELKRIRQKLRSKSPTNGIDLKHSPGGLIDIEFAVQTAFLHKQLTPPSGNTFEMITYLKSELPNWRSRGQLIEDTYVRVRAIEQLHQLLSSFSGSFLSEHGPTTKRLARFFGTSQNSLFVELETLLQGSSEALKDLDPINIDI